MVKTTKVSIDQLIGVHLMEIGSAVYHDCATCGAMAPHAVYNVGGDMHVWCLGCDNTPGIMLILDHQVLSMGEDLVKVLASSTRELGENVSPTQIFQIWVGGRRGGRAWCWLNQNTVVWDGPGLEAAGAAGQIEVTFR